MAYFVLLFALFIQTTISIEKGLRDDWITHFIRINTNRENDAIINNMFEVKGGEVNCNLIDSGSLEPFHAASSIPDCKFALPKYIAPRQPNRNLKKQIIPRTIFMSWKTNMIGFNQYTSIRKWLIDNPEYEFFFFDDSDVQSFMCNYFPTFIYLAYSILIPGAAKIDMWRYGIVYTYGGIYLDVDSGSKVPLSEVVWPNASVTAGSGGGDFNQWMLIFAPKHPVLKASIRLSAKRVLINYLQRSYDFIHTLTGPACLTKAFNTLLREAKCDHTLWNRKIKRKGAFVNLRYDTSDPSLAYYCNELLGVVQLYKEDYMGYTVLFKVDGVTRDMAEDGYVRYESQHEKHETLYSYLPVTDTVSRHNTTMYKVNKCYIQQGKLVDMYVSNMTLKKLPKR